MKSKLKIFFKIIILIIVVLNLLILVTGKLYLYKGVYNTYLKGRMMPNNSEYAIFDYRKIEARKPQPWPKSIKYNTATLSTGFENLFKEIETHAFVIIKNDSLIHEQYWEAYSDTSHTNSFSMAKSYIGALLGCALKEGFIKDINQLVNTFIPEFKNDWRQKITFKHLVTMTSGIYFDESYGNPFSFPAEGYYGEDLYKTCTKYDENEFEPGTIFNYLSGNTGLLGYCITKATHKTLSEYLSEKLWTPMGCEYTAFWSLDKKDGFEKAFCCINSNAKDFARLGQLYLNYGNWNGHQLIDSAYIKESITPFDCNELDGCKNRTYGYAWWLTNYKNMDVYFMRGILGQYVICIPQLKMVICRLGNKGSGNGNKHWPPDVEHCIEAAMQMYP